LRESRRLRREHRLDCIRSRHAARHEAQLKLGIEPLRHSYGERLEQRRQSTSGSAASTLAPTLALCSSAASVERPLAGNDSSCAGDASGGGIQRATSFVPIVVAPSRPPSSAELSLPSRSPGHSRRGSADIVADTWRSQHVAGLEGLLIPRYTMRSPSPALTNRAESPARTPPPLSPPSLFGEPQAGRAVQVARSQSVGCLPRPPRGSTPSAMASLAGTATSHHSALRSMGWSESHAQTLSRPSSRSMFSEMGLYRPPNDHKRRDGFDVRAEMGAADGMQPSPLSLSRAARALAD